MKLDQTVEDVRMYFRENYGHVDLYPLDDNVITEFLKQSYRHAHATAGAWRRKGLYREHATSQRGRRWARLARASTRILRTPVPAPAA